MAAGRGVIEGREGRDGKQRWKGSWERWGSKAMEGRDCIGGRDGMKDGLGRIYCTWEKWKRGKLYTVRGSLCPTEVKASELAGRALE